MRVGAYRFPFVSNLPVMDAAGSPLAAGGVGGVARKLDDESGVVPPQVDSGAAAAVAPPTHLGTG